MALTVNKQGGFGDVSNNIPNKQLWMKCVPLVIAGCMVTKEYMMALAKKKGTGDDKQETLSDGN